MAQLWQRPISIRLPNILNTDIQTYRHTDIQAYRHTDIQTYRHTDIQTYRNIFLLNLGESGKDPSKPNIIVVLGDDIGRGVSCPLIRHD